MGKFVGKNHAGHQPAFFYYSRKAPVNGCRVALYLRRLRELRGFDTKQADFARQLGISQGQLSRYEKGKSEIGAEVLLRISQRFGKSMEWVLTGKN